MEKLLERQFDKVTSWIGNWTGTDVVLIIMTMFLSTVTLMLMFLIKYPIVIAVGVVVWLLRFALTTPRRFKPEPVESLVESPSLREIIEDLDSLEREQVVDILLETGSITLDLTSQGKPDILNRMGSDPKLIIGSCTIILSPQQVWMSTKPNEGS